MPPESPSPEMPEFTAADTALVTLGAAQGAADAHGVLCALLSAPGAAGARAWLDLVGADSGGELPASLLALHAATVAQLAPASYDFSPLLPDDEMPLAVRVRALGQWCQGFLGGLGLCGIDPAKLGGEASEFVVDLAGIAQVALDSDESAEQAERDYTELVEYLRVGVYLVRDALHEPNAPAEEPA